MDRPALRRRSTVWTTGTGLPTRRSPRCWTDRRVSSRGDRSSLPVSTTPTYAGCSDAMNGHASTTACMSTTPDRPVGSNGPGPQSFTPRQPLCAWSQPCPAKVHWSMSRSTATGPHWSNQTACESIILRILISECCGTLDRLGCATRRRPLMWHASPRNSRPSRSWPTHASPGAPRPSACWACSTIACEYLADVGSGRSCSTSPRGRVRCLNTVTWIAWSGHTVSPEPLGRRGLPRRRACATGTSNTDSG